MALTNSPSSYGRLVGRWVVFVLLAASGFRTAVAQAPFGSDDPNSDLRIPPQLALGLVVWRVHIHVVNPIGDVDRDAAIVAELTSAFTVKAGDAFDDLAAVQALRTVTALSNVADAEYRVYRAESEGAVYVAVLVRLRLEEAAHAPKRSGLFETAKFSEIPILLQTERSQLRLLLNPSFGVYRDANPWLGNPEAFNPRYAVPDGLGWSEFGLEVGASGIVQLGRSPVFVYGSGSHLISGTFGNDVFSASERRTEGEVEKLYGGVLVAPKGSPLRFDFSVGRQKFSLNRNLVFGFVLGAINGGPRAASYLSPRNAQDLVVNARLRVGKALFQAFVSDPNELPVADSRSRFAGFNLKYTERRIDASVTVAGAIRGSNPYTLPDESSRSREGLRLVNPRVRWNSAFGVEHLWVEGEMAHQWHDRFPMSAQSAGGWIGYRFHPVRWKPALLYRYSWFSGDDPNTGTYERFDPLTGGVQRDWLQGMVMIKMLNNANLRTHRIEASIRPRPGMEVMVDLYRFRADGNNNLGSGSRPFQSWTSSDLGWEITPTVQWSITPNVFLQALVSSLVPGQAIKSALPLPASTWTTLQLSLYAGL